MKCSRILDWWRKTRRYSPSSSLFQQSVRGEWSPSPSLARFTTHTTTLHRAAGLCARECVCWCPWLCMWWTSWDSRHSHAAVGEVEWDYLYVHVCLYICAFVVCFPAATVSPPGRSLFCRVWRQLIAATRSSHTLPRFYSLLFPFFCSTPLVSSSFAAPFDLWSMTLDPPEPDSDSLTESFTYASNWCFWLRLLIAMCSSLLVWLNKAHTDGKCCEEKKLLEGCSVQGKQKKVICDLKFAGLSGPWAFWRSETQTEKKKPLTFPPVLLP